MSNQKIIKRLEEKVDDFVDGKVGKYEFTEFMINSVNALEGIQDRIIDESRDLEHKIEVAEFHDEDDSIQELSSVIGELKIWLSKLK
jgi:hypothetical protein